MRVTLHGLTALVLFTALFVWIGGVTRIDLNAPLIYNGDALEMLSYFDQQYIEDDMNLRLHAPFELQHAETWRYAFDALQHSNSNLIWAAYLVGGNSIRAMNFYFLATFLLIFASAYWVIGRLGLPDPFRFGAATLYALMPYHFQRSVGHLYESSYYLIPLLALVLVLLWQARPLAHRIGPHGWRFDMHDRRVWLVLALLILLGSFHPYHQFFFAALAASIAPLAGWYRRSWRPVLIGFGLAAIALLPLVLQSRIEHWLSDPQLALALDGQAIGGYGGAEVFPLKLIQIVLPVQGHHWPLLAEIRAMYDASNPLVNENSTTSLGLVGALGFVCLMVLPLVPMRRPELGTLRKFAAITLIGLLLAGMGGVSSIISTVSALVFGPTFPLTEARGWDRMILFVGFFSYVAAFWVLRLVLLRVHRRWFPRLPVAAITWPAFVAVLAFAFWDQIPGPIQQQQTSTYYSDQQFFAQIERKLPPASRIFQAPFVIHHVSGWVLPGVYYTEQLRPYINTRTLHFTYGGDQGTAQAHWYEAASKLPVDQQAPYLCSYGFAGFLVHRNMMKDPASLERAWQGQLGAGPTISPDNQLSFFDLRPYCSSHSIKPLDLAPIRERLLQQHADKNSRFFGAADLSSTIGELHVDSDGSISRSASTEGEGFLTFGPYVDLPPGHYSAAFDLAQDGDGTVALDVTAKRNGHLVQLSTAILSGSTLRFEELLKFEVLPGDSALEFRIQKPRGISAKVFGVRVNPLK